MVDPYANHGAGIQKPTKLGDFGQGQMWVLIFQHHGSHMGNGLKQNRFGGKPSIHHCKMLKQHND
jgi:hypothetical protein